MIGTAALRVDPRIDSLFVIKYDDVQDVFGL
jgi:hypothetical protein